MQGNNKFAFVKKDRLKTPAARSYWGMPQIDNNAPELLWFPPRTIHFFLLHIKASYRVDVAGTAQKVIRPLAGIQMLQPSM